MFSKTMMALAGTAAIVIAGPAIAAPGGNGGGMGGAGGASAAMTHGGGMAGSMGGMNNTVRDTARMNSQGPANASTTGVSNANKKSVLSGSTLNTGTRVNNHANSDTTVKSNGSAALQHSQGLTHASPIGIAHANQNSVLARGAVQTSTLTGLQTTLPVQTSTGTSLGTVTNIIYGPNNTTVRGVVVTSASGQTYTLPATSLSISGGVVTTTSTSVGG